ncbi:hypothetical protein J057_04806 [Marinobacter nanhaiticus D15-8W]|uniref:Uncharacterized protein n=2 Tax=Marinobacter TaxID=2742 RepID=N6WUE9_9GAMM|nr:hypothetical protein J057_04806 [Marinobacter nanhaiticus D15-8W]
MMTLAPERSWLLDRGLLKLVHQCRRLILAEFGVKLHLTDEDLEQRLASYAKQSRSSHLTRTWEELIEQVPELTDEDATPGSEDKRYRGQALTEPPAPASAAEGEGKTRTITYRGRKMVVPAH